MSRIRALQHTPGPWELFHKRNGKFATTAILMADTNRQIVGWSGFDSSDFERDNLANARLIAAAPAMLEALESLDAALNLDGLANQFPSAEEPVNKIKAAIRLAKEGSR